MRQKVDRQLLERFLHALAADADQHVDVYLTGGATAILLGWRDATIDVDLRLIPDNDRILRAIPELKERMNINVELASPADFIPDLPGWKTRSQFIMQDREVAFYHYDFYAQALSKIERFHQLDVLDVKEMLARKLIEPDRLRELFEAIVPVLYRFPAISPEGFRRNLNSILSECSSC
ncbi:MAG: hypothetical protein HY707_13960 [Ignavibacteriae bacterium]|nr:hypothetical protein [Ignavibacteriota bacterium]